MAKKSKLLTKQVVEFANGKLEEIGRSGAVAIKLRAISSAYINGINVVAKVFGITKATLISWIKHAATGSVDLLTVQAGRGRKKVLTDIHKEAIAKWMSLDSQITIEEIKHKLKSCMGITCHRSTVHRAMQEVGFSYITPRPKHYKQSSVDLVEAKKKSSRYNQSE